MRDLRVTAYRHCFYGLVLLMAYVYNAELLIDSCESLVEAGERVGIMIARDALKLDVDTCLFEHFNYLLSVICNTGKRFDLRFRLLIAEQKISIATFGGDGPTFHPVEKTLIPK